MGECGGLGDGSIRQREEVLGDYVPWHLLQSRAQHEGESQSPEGQVAMALPLVVSLYPAHTSVNSSQNTQLRVSSVSCQESH